MRKNNFAHTGHLVRFVLRRERISSAVWLTCLSLFSILLAPVLGKLFDSQARTALIFTINNPAMIAMLGPIYGISNYTQGAMYFNMMIQWVMLAAAIMNILFVIRHTRGDEERGRADMFRALPSGRLAGLSAVMIVSVILNLLLALLSGFGIAACSIPSMDLHGSLLYGAVLGAIGLVFAAFAAILSQLCSTSHGAVGLSVAGLGFFYLLRGAGDIGTETLSFISPLGLAQRTQAYVANHWLPVFLLLAEALVLTLIAYALNIGRDLGQGYLPRRKGRAKAPAYLRSPAGLAYRLLLLPFWGWVIGMFLVGAAYGSILGTIDHFVQSSAVYALMIGMNPNFSTAELFVSMVTALMGLCASVPALTMVLKLRSEEKDGYDIHLLSRSVSRTVYFAGYAAIAFAASILIQCASALGLYCAALAVLPDPGSLTLGYLLKANLVYLPAIWTMLGLGILLIGAAPKFLPAIWGYFGFTFVMTYLGRMPDLFPSWLAKLTPYGYIPNLPVDPIRIGTLLVLTGVAMILALLGFASYRKRDITAA